MSAGPRLDLHVHSESSPDSRLSVTEILQHLSSRGLDGFALTDHNSTQGHPRLRGPEGGSPRPILVPGVEVSTLEGHLLALGVAEPPPPQRPIAETIEWIRAQSGEAVPSHPFRRRHGIGGSVLPRVCVAALETRNGHNSPGANRRAEAWATDHALGATGGSDVHVLTDLGRCYTIFPEGTQTVDDVLEALRRHRTRAGGEPLSRWERVRLRLSGAGPYLRRGFRPI